ncbi:MULTISPECIES: hypothetical protein [unclassified Actinotalea]|uniref:hypothetical protein n=1 Tax=unclassified Actinotalea TaxID=2638618 RepID=UPI0015F6ADAF|nr:MULTISPECIES: hypothetical protein [unclassified Actinotalea]
MPDETPRARSAEPARERAEGVVGRIEGAVERAEDVVERAEEAAARAAERVPTPAWLRFVERVMGRVVYFALVAAVLAVVIAGVQRLIADDRVRLVVGIAMVVLLGAGGMFLRGASELTRPPLNEKIRAAGYFCGALAYVATATVALMNGLPHLVDR